MKPCAVWVLASMVVGQFIGLFVAGLMTLAERADRSVEDDGMDRIP